MAKLLTLSFSLGINNYTIAIVGSELLNNSNHNEVLDIRHTPLKNKSIQKLIRSSCIHSFLTSHL